MLGKATPSNSLKGDGAKNRPTAPNCSRTLCGSRLRISAALDLSIYPTNPSLFQSQNPYRTDTSVQRG